MFLLSVAKLQNWTSKTSLCFGVKETPKITYQPYPGIYIICMNLHHIFWTAVTSVAAVSYHFALKIQSPARGINLHSPEV